MLNVLEGFLCLDTWSQVLWYNEKSSKCNLYFLLAIVFKKPKFCQYASLSVNISAYFFKIDFLKNSIANIGLGLVAGQD